MTSVSDFYQQVLETNIKTLREIQRLTESQKELWQRVPYLALQADWNPYPSEKCLIAYTKGFWPIVNPVDKCILSKTYIAYIDCATGRLWRTVDARLQLDMEELLIIAMNPFKTDAENVIASLTKISQNKLMEPFSQQEIDPEFVEAAKAWKSALAKQLGLKEVFERKENYEY